MTTVVESPGIASAKEEAAAILFAREPQAPVMTAPAPEQPIHTAHEQLRPSFAHYHEPEAIPVRPKAVDTTELRPYEHFDEVAVAPQTQVLHPYIENNEYLSTPVETATVTVAAPTTTVVETPQTVTVVESPLDTQLEEGTQYIVKFKKSTIIAASIVASIIMLMAVLFIVNIISLATMSAEVSALTQESTALERSLAEGQANLEKAREAADASGSATEYTVQYVAKAESTYAEPSSANVHSSFFDWLCHSLSRLFN